MHVTPQDFWRLSVCGRRAGGVRAACGRRADLGQGASPGRPLTPAAPRQPILLFCWRNEQTTAASIIRWARRRPPVLTRTRKILQSISSTRCLHSLLTFRKTLFKETLCQSSVREGEVVVEALVPRRLLRKYQLSAFPRDPVTHIEVADREQNQLVATEQQPSSKPINLIPSKV